MYVFVVGSDMCSGHGRLQARLIENVLKVGERERESQYLPLQKGVMLVNGLWGSWLLSMQ